ncbi:hypothetical protein ACFL6G_00265 [candidate division KSB1 bacterium]
MENDFINVWWTLAGIFIWPELTLAIILWILGHPLLALIALIFASTTNVKTVIREKIIDSHTGTVIKETEIKH